MIFARVAVVAVLFVASQASADLPRLTDDGWHTWRVAAIEDAPDWCCYVWNRSRVCDDSCNLDERDSGYGPSDDDSSSIDQMQIYALMKGGEVTKIRALSAQCPGTTKTAILDLGVVDTEASVRWLRTLIGSHTRISMHALAAISVHGGPESLDALIDIAANDSDLENRKEAVFWMGQVRGTEAEEDIERLMFADDNADFREHAAFSLSQSDAPGRVDALARLGKEDSDGDVRSQAWFWLAQTEFAEGEEEIQKAIRDEKDGDVREQAIFALSQLPEERAAKALTKVIENRRLSKEDRKQALFWLAQLESESAMAYIDRLLSGS